MDNYKFEKICKNIVKKYLKQKEIDINIEDIYTVWICKTLGNNKILISTNIYELTYNGNKKEIYFDDYKNHKNEVIKEEEFNENV